MLRKINPKNQRVRRALKAREPKLVENVKKSLVLKGSASSDIVKKTLQDLHAMKKPDSKLFTKRNMTRPFEDQSSIEFLAQQNDTSLFVFGSHSKKRPHNLVFGRLFDSQLLDMFEFGVDASTFKSMKDLEGQRTAPVRYGSKPCFVFQGDEFETNADFVVLKNLLLDFFRGEVLEKINLAALDRLISCTVVGNKVCIRHYAIAFKKSGTKVPRVELEEVGPTLDLTLRRRKSAAESLQKAAYRLPRATAVMPRKRKNVEQGEFTDTMGRIHMERQDFDDLALAKRKELRTKRSKTENGETRSDGGNMEVDDQGSADDE